MKGTAQERMVRWLKGRRRPVSPLGIAKAVGVEYKRVREILIKERKASGSSVFRIGGYAKVKGRRVVGYLLGPGEDAKVVKYGDKYRRWTTDEEHILRQHVGELPILKIAELLGRDVRVTRRKLREMGFERGQTENTVPKGFEHLGRLPLDTVQKQWVGGHIFRRAGNKPGIVSILVHNSARRGEDKELQK